LKEPCNCSELAVQIHYTFEVAERCLLKSFIICTELADIEADNMRGVCNENKEMINAYRIVASENLGKTRTSSIYVEILGR